MQSNDGFAGGHDAIPGEGWTNGELAPSMYPTTREGRVELYSSHRRWINPFSSWTRIGSGSEHDSVHSESASGTKLIECEKKEAETIRALIAQLCERFYNFGWATGTGGGVSIRCGGPSEGRPWRVFVAPSGIQKEDMVGNDVFELDMDQNVVVPPQTPNLRQSACTPLWYVVYKNRPSARAVIHTHSMYAQMATMLDPTEESKCLKVTHLEMLKGVGNHAYDDVLEIPIIDNRPSEDLLADQLETVINEYPKANAVLVRRHGIYVWGDSWEQAKTQCESFDYLFHSAIQMKSMGIDPGMVPKVGTYREEDEKASGSGGDTKKREAETGEADQPPASKRAKTTMNGGNSTASSGFNASGDTDNRADLASNNLPLVPRDRKILLLDIEGCTTSISFVKDILFPFVLEHLDDYLHHVESVYSADTLRETLEMLHQDVRKLDDDHIVKQALSDVLDKTAQDGKEAREQIKMFVHAMVKADVKATGLKQFQGKMWKMGYDSGEIKGHVYPDFCFLLKWCKANNVSVNIYSSGSIQAQKLLFGHTLDGDLLQYIDKHFDTTSGSKKEKESYETIAKSLGVSPRDIIFVSDLEDELVAARDAGIGCPVMSIRPGNAPLTSIGKSFPSIYSLLQVCGV
mmetsp:Transcript_13927/g.21718  ORF Transcript_13927/g.21718 Transcript_13927/m.21718 type:complete len:631 (-) Transcript_13927:1355-3247(-)